MQQKKFFNCITKVKSGEEEYIIELFPSVFGNTDYDNDIMKAGAFADSIKRKKPVGVWAHSWDKPIAKTLVARELLPGDSLLPEELKAYGALYIKAQFFPDIPSSLEAYKYIANGVIEEFSVGFSIKDYEYEGSVRIIKEAELYEWSPVLRGANELGRVLSVKGMTFKQHTDHIIEELDNYTTRVEELYSLRGKLSEEKIQVLISLHDRLASIINPVVESNGNEGDEPKNETASEEANTTNNEEISLEDFIRWGETI